MKKMHKHFRGPHCTHIYTITYTGHTVWGFTPEYQISRRTLHKCLVPHIAFLLVNYIIYILSGHPSDCFSRCPALR